MDRPAPETERARRPTIRYRLRIAVPVALVLLLADCTSKSLAVEHLTPERHPHQIAGDFLRLTLAYNQGAAMGIPLGPGTRWLLIAASLAAVIFLVAWVWRSPATATPFRLAAGLVLGGAIGNLLDRLFSPRGVVDFIDVGWHVYRFWTFNLADVGITAGAVLLTIGLWRQELEKERS
jgi:signal peptidase II